MIDKGQQYGSNNGNTLKRRSWTEGLAGLLRWFAFLCFLALAMAVSIQAVYGQSTVNDTNALNKNLRYAEIHGDLRLNFVYTGPLRE
eukprot:3516394-Prorocentrum_lima.AAC.1